jgi:hypothetical protein
VLYRDTSIAVYDASVPQIVEGGWQPAQSNPSTLAQFQRWKRFDSYSLAAPAVIGD